MVLNLLEMPFQNLLDYQDKKFQKRKMKRSMAGGQGRSMYGTMNDASDLI